MDAAMASMVEAIRIFLTTHHTEATTISRLQLTLYLVGNYSDAIGPVLSEAIDSGIVRDLDLAVLDEQDPSDCTDEDMLQRARSVDAFFSAYPSVLHCLTRLSLHNVCFAEWDTMNHVLFDCCKQLRHLYLSNCATGAFTWTIHAPDSNLTVLELDFCLLVKLEVLNLPKLEKLNWDFWLCPHIPFLLGDVPALKELLLLTKATVYFKGFKLSEALGGATAIQDLTISFQGENLWMNPEGQELCAAFSKLRKLSVQDIFFEFSPMEQQITFIKAVMVRSPNLQTVVLKDHQHCKDCEKLHRSERVPAERAFPKGKDEQDVVVNQLIGDGVYSRAQIIFCN
ncbi:hypothetical protein PR202_gb25448 [Eleusine coracana subsp. coracana]|uniref:Uncharacterized protein n=1 Tax=Eleusine coracana subsp. coracana TaxID=191504 RepID=A0AAV5FP03_ELECO|nr:hypothetical protein QOZ80_8BG0652150 [Eleusine coracana subsp. coracana]GJN36574.1 hypothetical protein PR202_gb25448 [Eleusine coracana subsp. coracana]